MAGRTSEWLKDQPKTIRNSPARLRIQRSAGAGGRMTALRWWSVASNKISSDCTDCIPVLRMTSCPPANPIVVGMPMTLSICATSGLSSALIFQTSTCWSYLAATCLMAGSIARQGAHQGAQRSTTMGRGWVLSFTANSDAFMVVSEQGGASGPPPCSLSSPVKWFRHGWCEF